MQNKQIYSVIGTCENKRPNILRRKTNEKFKAVTSLLQNSQSVVSTESVAESISSLNVFEGDSAPSYCVLLHNRFENDFGTQTYDKHKINSKTEKTISRRHKPSKKIILDTYVCDKSRNGKQKLKEDNRNNENIESLITLLDYDAEVVEEINTELFQPSVTQQDVVQENGAESQEINLQTTRTVLPATHSILVDANLESENILRALHDNGLPEGQMLLVSGDEGETKEMWLCPLATCNMLFSDKTVLDSHILSHFDLKTFTCNIDKCNKIYINEDKLKQHQNECHATESPNVPSKPVSESWEEIKKKARNLQTEALTSVGVTEDMMQSVSLADGTRCWPCFQQGCQLAFKTQYLLKSHIIAHFDLRPFKCTHQGCGWAFRSVAKLRVHSEIHLGVRKHSCSEPGCSRTFSSKLNLTFHMNKVHGDGAGVLSCPKSGCLQTFTDKSTLKEHVNSLHADNKCDVCGKKFWKGSRSRTHVHTRAELQCTWPGCGRVFSQPSRLRYHHRSHTGDKPYRCTYPSCFWAFPSASKLKRHARAHAGTSGRKYMCSICNRAFLRPEHLREHHLRHFPHKQYMCDVEGCDEAFANKSSVYAHKKRYHNGSTEGQSRLTRKAPRTKIVVSPQEIQTPLTEESEDICVDEMLSLRSARTHVPWSRCQYKMLPGINIQDVADNKSVKQEDCNNMLQHHSGIEEKQGNPLVCGGLELEGVEEIEGSSVGAELCLGDGDVSQQGVDLNINSLLMQEELSEGMLYTTEEESALHVLLLNEEPPP